MQGGLWRLTGQQIAGAAAEGEGAGPSSSKGGAGGAEGGGGEDVRGPHASLAVKLQVCMSPKLCTILRLQTPCPDRLHPPQTQHAAGTQMQKSPPLSLDMGLDKLQLAFEMRG